MLTPWKDASEKVLSKSRYDCVAPGYMLQVRPECGARFLAGEHYIAQESPYGISQLVRLLLDDLLVSQQFCDRDRRDGVSVKGMKRHNGILPGARRP